MITKVINKNSVIIYQTFMDDDIELNGEQALLVQDCEGSGLISISQGETEVLINYDSVKPLLKTLKAIMSGIMLYDVKL